MSYEPAQGKSTLEITTPNIEEHLAQVSRKRLLNVGMLRLQALKGSEAEITINMIVHVSKDKTDETTLTKTVLNPLDGWTLHELFILLFDYLQNTELFYK